MRGKLFKNQPQWVFFLLTQTITKDNKYFKNSLHDWLWNIETEV